MPKIKNGSFVCLRNKLKINAYDHSSNVFEAYPENEEDIDNNIIYIPGMILDVRKTYVYEPLNVNKYEYDVALDLRYHVQVSIPQTTSFRENYTDSRDDEEFDSVKIYYVNKFKRNFGKEQKLSSFGDNRVSKTNLSLPYKLYIIEPGRFYDKDGSYEMIPAEMDSINSESAYYNKGTTELTIIKSSTKKILSMKPEGNSWVNSVIDYTKLEGKLLDIQYPYDISYLVEMKSILDDYNGEIDEEELRSIYNESRAVAQVEISGMTVNFLLKHIRFI